MFTLLRFTKQAVGSMPRGGQYKLARLFSAAQSYKNLIVENKGGVTLITFNRPKALNALCDELIHELNSALKAADTNDEIGAIVITGSEKAFAAGADIKEMKDKTYSEALQKGLLSHWDQMLQIKKPIIAAVNGYALGGGCELAMSCDIIVAGTNAKFGQPEVVIGTIPGGGGSQRLCKAIGKSRAMEMILTGDQMDAKEAEQRGLVSRLYEPSKTVEEAVKIATKIASYSRPIVALCKETVNAAYELPMTSGLKLEKRLFHSTFAFKDQKEGMSAFAEKRKPKFTNN